MKQPRDEKGRFRKLTESELDFSRLVRKVHKINPKAARILEDHENSLTDCNFNFSGNLKGCFIWRKSPQRHEFWQEIAERLGEI